MSKLDTPGGTERRRFEPTGEGRPALVIVRNPSNHDSRILRESETLRKLGYRPQILGVVSEDVRERHAVIQGVRVTRLDPTSPFAWVRSRLPRPRPRGGADASSNPARRGAATSVTVRIHRWMRTLDFYRRAIGVVRELRPALIHCNDYNTMWIGVAARMMGGTVVVYDSHELWADRNLRPEPRWWLLVCEFLFVRFAHLTITASPGYSEVIARRYRIPPPGVVRNIPIADSMGAASADGAGGKSPGWSSRSSKAPLVLYVGALTSGRGLEVAIRAMALVESARLRFVGPVNHRYRAELIELAEREGVADRVELPGAVAPERLLETASEADVGLALIQPVCLSYRMSLPNKLFEYVAAGVPVLGSDLPAIGALVRGYGIGLVAQPDDVAEIAAKLSEMLQPDRNRELRLAVRAAAKELRWDREARVLADNYAEAARPRRVSSPTRIRPRLSRTFSRGRWGEYRRFLELARRHGYRIVSLESWVSEGEYDGVGPTLILRHDVDQHPRSALAMAAIEEELGVRSSWYFRWRTAHPEVISRLQQSGFEVGLHYETLTRHVREQGASTPVDESMIDRSRRDLQAETAAFARRFGPIRGAVPHGDSRVPGVHNAELLRDRDCADYGIEYDGNEVMRGRELGYWLTDRTAAEGRWKGAIDPAELFAARTTPILCVTHPNNWASGPSLWLDRGLSALLPDSTSGRSRPIRTGSDQPQL